MSPMSMSDVLDSLQSSTCTTTIFRSPSGGNDFRNVDNGYYKAGMAVNRVAKTYIGALIVVANNAIPANSSPFVDFRIGAWDYTTLALRACTQNLAGIMNAVPRDPALTDINGGVDITGNWLTPLTLAEGERIIVGTCTYGDYDVRNLGLCSEKCRKAFMQRAPQLGFRRVPVHFSAGPGDFPTGGYEGGIPGSITSEPSGNWPMVDLF